MLYYILRIEEDDRYFKFFSYALIDILIVLCIWFFFVPALSILFYLFPKVLNCNKMERISQPEF